MLRCIWCEQEQGKAIGMVPVGREWMHAKCHMEFRRVEAQIEFVKMVAEIGQEQAKKIMAAIDDGDIEGGIQWVEDNS